MKTLGFKQLQNFLIDLHKTKTLRQIAEENYDSKITHGAIDRCIKGKEPRDKEIRKALNLPEIITQEVWRDEEGRWTEAPQ